MAHDHDTVPAPEPLPSRAEVIVAGHHDDAASRATLHAGLASDDPSLRAAAVGGLFRRGDLTEEQLLRCLGDRDPLVRSRAVLVAGETSWGDSIDAALTARLADADELIVVTALVALADRRPDGVVDAVIDLAADERPLVQEEAVATLGALGDERGLPAVLAATSGKPALRRRTVAALGGFEGPAVEHALDELAADRDWQVRQAVAMLRREPFDDESAISRGEEGS